MKSFKNSKKIVFSLVLSLFMLSVYSQTTNRTKSAGPTECAKVAVDEQIKVKKISYVPNNDLLYDIRDKFLDSSVRGKRYIEEYYYVSTTKKDYSALKFSTLTDIVSLMPSIESAFEKVNNNSYSGIIVDSKMSGFLTNILLDFKSLSSDSKYTSIVDNLLTDLKAVTNKDKKVVLDFMKK